MRRIELTLRADRSFPVPDSDGYQVYGALLSALDTVDASVSQRVHDSPLGTIHNSGLRGSFAGSDRPHHKRVRANEPYGLSLGVVDRDDEELFETLVNAFVLDGDDIRLAEGTLRVESFESSNATHEELLERASDVGSNATLDVEFHTATCIEEAGEVTTMFPHRVSVFRSLLGKWNRTAPEELALDIGREAIAGSVIEKPDPRAYDTHSVLVNRVENGDGGTRPLFRQGFTGQCSYAFKNASESVRNAVTALGMFGEYSGVGSAVARGCGSVEVGLE